jgi:hypothetical protein
MFAIIREVPPHRVTGRGRGRFLVRGADMTKRTCSIPGCTQPQHGRGLCSKHYQRWQDHGDPGREPFDRSRRVLEKVVRGEGCWAWTANHTNEGYGVVTYCGVRTTAHRVVYQLLVGPIPAGMQLDHLCRNPSCVNPFHLEAVSGRENLRRGQGWSGRHAQQTHCVNGHEFTPENTLLHSGSGGRRCRECHADHQRRYRARQGVA